jgi:polysaccharide biosynthesis/export protein
MPGHQWVFGIGCRLCARAITVAILIGGYWGTILPARAEYRIDVGDVIEISAARIPELQRRVVVQSDGSISFPMLGTLVVAGSTVPEVQAKIQTILAAKIFRQRAADGREIAIVIGPDELSATIAEYRPIYVNGDVSRPGEHPFRPLMTVRQAVALSGGYDALRGKSNSPLLDPADLTSDNETSWIQFAKIRAQVWRIKSELGDKDNIDQATLMDVPVVRSTLNEIIRVESEQLKSRQDNFQHERTFLLHSIKQVGEQIAVLTEQQQKEEQGTQSDVEELQRVNDLFSKGSLPITRVTDARRAVLLSATRKLQTTAQLMAERKQQDDFARQLERLDDQRRVDLLHELQDANVRLGEIRAKLRGIEMKLQMTTVARIRLGHDETAKAEISIHRIGVNGWVGFAADEDVQLHPGDVIEVMLRPQHAVVGVPETMIEVPSPLPHTASAGPIMGAVVEGNPEAKEPMTRSSAAPLTADNNQPAVELTRIEPAEAAIEPEAKAASSVTNTTTTTQVSGAAVAMPPVSIGTLRANTLEAQAPSGAASATRPAAIPNTVSAHFASAVAALAAEKPTTSAPKATASFAGRTSPVRRRQRPLASSPPSNLLP